MKIYNTLTNKKEEFHEINKGKVTIYSCGPTVYNYFHIGNARPFITFDLLRNFMEYIGYEVKFVQNFTDVDDKIIKRAKEENLTPKEVADKYIQAYYEDAKALGIRKATVHPRVTDVMDDIIKYVQDLVDGGYAYELNGDVYFEVDKFKGYGKLSNKNIDELEAGARIGVNEQKKSPMDFALWKAKKEGEIAWDSPWGEGRPGWHIECSVMSTKYLGEHIDIHCGGADLIFPHHENEIAQSEAHNHEKFANYWMHNGYINVDNVKMSKSLGNFFTVRDVLEHYTGDVLRFFMLSAHYKSPINYSKELLDAAKTSLDRIKNCKKNTDFIIKNLSQKEFTAQENDLLKQISVFKDSFIEKMSDDLNSADAIAVIFDLVKFANSNINENSSKAFAQQILDLLNELTGVLNIANLDTQNSDIDEEKIFSLIEERANAKKAKDFARADQIRDELLDMGIQIKDTRTGTQWLRA
ncbi:cysteine--tRNA ligase [Criibacterium bergeronii]|uniref:Cysteine--tRNA ligase n=1 Tax=Criibacterium bergeronii TaxID=1871336 RepID=A0A552V533_9FIRM|nr:cysteine--tRNA ligase [Criibacterium bergeronii]TRW25549.1 cysteine--tRNA ligase [Criibacterium bergeronii]